MKPPKPPGQAKKDKSKSLNLDTGSYDLTQSDADLRKYVLDIGTTANLLFEAYFEDDDVSKYGGIYSGQPWTYQWWAVENAVRSTDWKHSGTYSLMYNETAGETNSLADTHWPLGDGGRKQWHVGFYIYFAAGYDFTQGSGGHWWRFNRGYSGGYALPSIDMEIDESWLEAIYSELSSQIATITPGSTTWAAETEYYIEHNIKMNTQGQSDGHIYIWRNGTLIYSETGMEYCENSDYDWNLLRIMTNDGRPSATEKTYYIDEVKVWDADPLGRV